MIQSHVFVVLAVTLCFVTCFSADAKDDQKDKAEQDVKDLQKLTAGVFDKAQTKSRNAESVKTTVEEQKDKAVRAELDVKTAETKITAANRKTEAAAVAQRAKSELDNCDELYQNAKNKADQASNDMKDFLTRARELDKKAKEEILPASSQAIDYAQVIQNAETATSDTKTLNQQIVASTVLSDADFALSQLRDGAQKVQVLKYQAESLFTVSNIEAKMSEAKNDIQSIQQKKEEINTIVEEMNAKYQSASDSLKGFLNSLCTNAQSQLRTATNKVKAAQKCNEDMQVRKTQLDKDLQTLMDRTDDESNALKDAGTVTWHTNEINKEIEKIKEALQATENYLTNAKNQQQQMLREMSPNNRQTGTELKEKQKANAPTEEVTNPIRNAEENEPVITSAEKPTVIKTDEPEITETEKPILGKSEDTMDKTSDQPVDANFDNTEENKSTQLAHEGKQNPKDGNSELLNNDKLRKITKDINNPLIGGELPTRSAANDSAVTVFIPLLVILVMSAVLH